MNLPSDAKVTPPERMDHHEKSRVRQAAFTAARLYPGPLGDLVSQDLLAWEEFGYRLGNGKDALIMAVVGYIERCSAQAEAAR